MPRLPPRRIGCDCWVSERLSRTGCALTPRVPRRMDTALPTAAPRRPRAASPPARRRAGPGRSRRTASRHARAFPRGARRRPSAPERVPPEPAWTARRGSRGGGGGLAPGRRRGCRPARTPSAERSASADSVRLIRPPTRGRSASAPQRSHQGSRKMTTATPSLVLSTTRASSVGSPASARSGSSVRAARRFAPRVLVPGIEPQRPLPAGDGPAAESEPGLCVAEVQVEGRRGEPVLHERVVLARGAREVTGAVEGVGLLEPLGRGGGS